MANRKTTTYNNGPRENHPRAAKHTNKAVGNKPVDKFMQAVNQRSAERQREAARLMREAAR